MNGRPARILWITLAVGVISVTCGGSAFGQLVGMGGASGTTANPFATPYANPFMNPFAAALSQQPLDTGTMALYFMAARQAGGGVGTGIPSGTRQAPGGLSKERRLADDKHPTGSNVPGALASRYFNRTTTAITPGASRYYNRQARSLPTIGQSR